MTSLGVLHKRSLQYVMNTCICTTNPTTLLPRLGLSGSNGRPSRWSCEGVGLIIIPTYKSFKFRNFRTCNNYKCYRFEIIVRHTCMYTWFITVTIWCYSFLLLMQELVECCLVSYNVPAFKCMLQSFTSNIRWTQISRTGDTDSKTQWYGFYRSVPICISTIYHYG